MPVLRVRRAVAPPSTWSVIFLRKAFTLPRPSPGACSANSARCRRATPPGTTTFRGNYTILAVSGLTVKCFFHEKPLMIFSWLNIWCFHDWFLFLIVKYVTNQIISKTKRKNAFAKKTTAFVDLGLSIKPSHTSTHR